MSPFTFWTEQLGWFVTYILLPLTAILMAGAKALKWPRATIKKILAFTTATLVATATVYVVLVWLFFPRQPASLEGPDTDLPVAQETDSVTIDFSVGSSHCRPTGEVRRRINARAGWAIDVESIKSNLSSNPESSTDIDDKSPSGFDIVAVVQNRGKCFGPFKDARGAVWGTVTYVQTRGGQEAP